MVSFGQNLLSLDTKKKGHSTKRSAVSPNDIIRFEVEPLTIKVDSRYPPFQCLEVESEWLD